MHTRPRAATAALLTCLLLTACGGGGGDGGNTASAATTTTAGATGTTTTTGTATGSTSSASGTAANTGTTATTATTTTTTSVDATKLPLGDNKFTTTAPAVGYVYACYSAGQGGATTKGPWFNGDGSTWNSTSKISVQGVVNWVSTFAVALGSTLGITGNGLPSQPTGTFPIASTDPAYAYDRNPNSIKTSAIAWGLPANPTVAATPSCTGLGAIGVLLDGARLFNADDGGYRDAVAWEVQDACQGHPQQQGTYHYHSVSSCLTQKDTAGQHSPLVGYIADGFGLYGNLGENGKALTNADLDVCHGHTHAITVNGVSVVQYHYHQTKEFPYTVGCFRGTPATIS